LHKCHLKWPEKKLAKVPYFPIIFYVFSSTNWRTKGQNRVWEGRVEVAQIMCTHVSKCKNDKNKILKSGHRKKTTNHP
jgi:hypothetical protein